MTESAKGVKFFLTQEKRLSWDAEGCEVTAADATVIAIAAGATQITMALQQIARSLPIIATTLSDLVVKKKLGG